MNKESEFLFLKNSAPHLQGKLSLKEGKPQLIELFSEFEKSTQEKAKKEIENRSLQGLWVAAVIAVTREMSAVGYGVIARLNYPDSHLWLGEAYVSPAYRKHGVYKGLLEERLSMLRDNDASAVSIQPNATVSDNPDENFEAERRQVLYLKEKGFRKDRRYSRLFHETIFTKTFNPPYNGSSTMQRRESDQ